MCVHGVGCIRPGGVLAGEGVDVGRKCPLRSSFFPFQHRVGKHVPDMSSLPGVPQIDRQGTSRERDTMTSSIVLLANILLFCRHGGWLLKTPHREQSRDKTTIPSW